MTEQVIQDLNVLFEQDISMTKGQRKVLQAAVALFATQGFDGTSTAQIATRSQMSQGTIFKYYPTKKELLRAIIDPAIDHLFPTYSVNFVDHQVPKNVKIEEFVRVVVANRLTFVYTNRHILQILTNEFLINDALVAETKQRLGPIIQRLLDQVTLLLVDEQMQPAEFMRLLVGQMMYEFIRMTRLTPAAEYDITATANSITTVMIAAIKQSK
ncbi:TetR/AcrR family transcriptional regulator [Weissella soli]|uniref:TetR/AcrR family transcriptional regulator n=1 Tax=Weissella soli TaxID=155866 RepID=UPI0011BBEC51|nr:TetR/AcrR family transcriptional regulator [Weissella soli]QEA34706.1 TetR/AcrR family transcriptional regulator [Weissella soli]